MPGGSSAPGGLGLLFLNGRVPPEGKELVAQLGRLLKVQVAGGGEHPVLKA